MKRAGSISEKFVWSFKPGLITQLSTSVAHVRTLKFQPVDVLQGGATVLPRRNTFRPPLTSRGWRCVSAAWRASHVTRNSFWPPLCCARSPA